MNDKPEIPLDTDSSKSIREWATWLHVTEEVLMHAVGRVGTMPAALGFYLAPRKPVRRSSRKTQDERAALEVRKFASSARGNQRLGPQG